MKLVVVESPFGSQDWSEVRRNIWYARTCIKDALNRGENPYCSHLFFPQPGILVDNDPEDRRRGIEAGLVWGDNAEVRAVYTDLGITPGMRKGIERAQEIGQSVDERVLSPGLKRKHGSSREGKIRAIMEIVSGFPQHGIWL